MMFLRHGRMHPTPRQREHRLGVKLRERPAPPSVWLCGRVWSGGGGVDLAGVGSIDRRANDARGLSRFEHSHHVTRDTEADASGWCHRVEDDASVRVHCFDVAVPVVAVPGVLPAATEARHVAHHVPVDDLEPVEALHLRTGVDDEGGPHDLGEVAVRLVGGLIARETSREILRVSAGPGVALCVRGARGGDRRGTDGCECEFKEAAATEHDDQVTGAAASIEALTSRSRGRWRSLVSRWRVDFPAGANPSMRILRRSDAPRLRGAVRGSRSPAPKSGSVPGHRVER